MTDNEHAPTPEFLAHLEWEVVRAARRERRIGTAPPPFRRLRVAGLAIACLALGVAGNFASAQVGDGRRRDSLSTAVQADLDVLALRLRLAAAQLDVARRRAAAGAGANAEVAAADMEVRALEMKRARRALDLAEIQASALPPRDDLTAPTVDGRDYVEARLLVQLAEAQKTLRSLEVARVDTERKVRLGVLSELVLAEEEARLTRAEAALAVDAGRLTARRDFLEKRLTATAVARQVQATEVREEVRVAQKEVELARRRLQLVRKQQAAGTVTELDLMRADLDLREREVTFAAMVKNLRRMEEARRKQD